MNIFIAKFIKAFITGGLAAISATLAAGVSFGTLGEAKHILVVFVIAFLSGGVHAGYNALFPTV